MTKRKRSNNNEQCVRKKLRTISNSELNRAKPKEPSTITKSKTMTTSNTIARNPHNGMKSCAVLVDAENISHRNLSWILQKIESMGYNTAIRRAYGDFVKNPSLWRWQTIRMELSLQLIQAHKYVSGKNTSDAAMMIGAMDLLLNDAGENNNNNNSIECFVLVTSDSDFTPLVKRIKESGKEVLGFGNKKSPLPLMNEYNRFICIEIPESTTSTENNNKKTKLTEPQKIQLLTSVINFFSDKDGWTNLSAIGVHIPFTSKEYGYKKWNKYFAANSEHFQLDKARCLVRNRLSHDQRRSCCTEDLPNNLSKQEQLIQLLTNVIHLLSDKDGWASLFSTVKIFPGKTMDTYSKISKYFEANTEHFHYDKARSLLRNRLPDDQRRSSSSQVLNKTVVGSYLL